MADNEKWLAEQCRNATPEEQAWRAAGQQNAACVHGRIKANCLECGAPEMLELLRTANQGQTPIDWAAWFESVTALLARFPR